MGPLECLLRGIQLGWSGCIEVTGHDAAPAPMGQIVLMEGRVAWATCQSQTETLGVFLWRLGRISRPQLTTIRRVYKQHQGQRKLGAIVEELGFMSQPMLRRCLMLHIRSALEMLLALPGTEAHMAEAQVDRDEHYLFAPAEVLPAHHLDELDEILGLGAPGSSWFTLNRDNLVLKELTGLPGYLAAAILSADGDVVTAHTTSDAADLVALGVLVSAMAEAFSRAAGPSSLGPATTLTLSYAEGTLSARWIDGNKSFFALVLVRETGDPVELCRALDNAAPRLRAWLDSRAEGAAAGPTFVASAVTPR